MSDNNLLSTKLISEHINAELDRHIRWFNSPGMVAYREQRDREWRALPFYTKVWRRMRGRFYAYRLRLGEIIAGREFE